MPRRSPSRRSTNTAAIRTEAATVDDLQALVELEDTAFSGDRISARSWRRLMTSPSATVTVALDAANGDARIVGSAVVLQRSNSSVARLYSIAASPDARGR